jgi:hypothetical protein
MTSFTENRHPFSRMGNSACRCATRHPKHLQQRLAVVCRRASRDSNQGHRDAFLSYTRNYGTHHGYSSRFGSGAVCAKPISLSFRSRLYRRGICLPLAAKQQIPRATIPRFGMTIVWGFFELHLPTVFETVSIRHQPLQSFCNPFSRRSLRIITQCLS